MKKFICMYCEIKNVHFRNYLLSKISGKKQRTKYNKKRNKIFFGLAPWVKNRDKLAMSEKNNNLDPQPSTSTCSQDSTNDSQQTPTCFRASMSNHVNNGDCHVNYEGSSPAMEDEAAVVFWQRSIEKHKMRYRYLTEIQKLQQYRKC